MARDIIKDIIFAIIVGVLSFGWFLIMLLIISFVTVSYLHFEIEKMIVASVIFGIGAMILSAVSKAKKYIKDLNNKKCLK